MSAAARLRRSAGFAWSGLAHAWREQPNFRLELAIGASAALMAVWLGTGLVPVVLSAALVISLELLNSAVEALVDLASPQQNPLARAAKDMSAGAVLVASLAALVVGLLALGPALLQRLGGA
ncbi:MAG: diacylglycerol kinase family protein [Trueperaceae bacterium]